MSKELDIAKETLLLDQGEELSQAFKALFFPTSKFMKQVPRIRWGKEFREEEKRKDADVQDGILALTNKRIFWLEERGTIKKTFHSTFFIELKDISSMNMQGTFAKRMNILSSYGEAQFRFGGMEKFIELVSKLRSNVRVESMPQVTAAPAPLEELKKLKELLDMGAITQEEYEDKKKKLLQKV
jgi:hypothetical protein